MSCELRTHCVFEPIHGRAPDQELCDNHEGCVGCSYSYISYDQDEWKKTLANPILGSAESFKKSMEAFKKKSDESYIKNKNWIDKHVDEVVSRWKDRKENG